MHIIGTHRPLRPIYARAAVIVAAVATTLAALVAAAHAIAWGWADDVSPHQRSIELRATRRRGPGQR